MRTMKQTNFASDIRVIKSSPALILSSLMSIAIGDEIYVLNFSESPLAQRRCVNSDADRRLRRPVLLYILSCIAQQHSSLPRRLP